MRSQAPSALQAALAAVPSNATQGSSPMQGAPLQAPPMMQGAFWPGPQAQSQAGQPFAPPGSQPLPFSMAPPAYSPPPLPMQASGPLPPGLPPLPPMATSSAPFPASGAPGASSAAFAASATLTAPAPPASMPLGGFAPPSEGFPGFPQTSMQLGMYPGQPGGYPGMYPGQYPGQPGMFPGQPGGYPGQPGGYPGMYPNQPGMYPNQPGMYPGQPGAPGAGRLPGLAAQLLGRGRYPGPSGLVPSTPPVPPPPGETGEHPVATTQVPLADEAEREEAEAQAQAEFEDAVRRARADAAREGRKEQAVRVAPPAAVPPLGRSAPLDALTDAKVLVRMPAGPTEQRRAARRTGRYRMEDFGLYVGRKPAHRWAWEDRMERRLQHAVLVHMSGHVKPPGDRALGLDAELGEDAGERELLMRGGAVVGEGGDAPPVLGTPPATELLSRRVESADPFPSEPFDANGVMEQEADPIKRVNGAVMVAQIKRGDPLAPHRQLEIAGPSFMSAGAAEFPQYALEVEVGRVEMAAHPAMAREDWLAARLRAMHRDTRLRAAVGLERHYWERLLALEEDLLSSREAVFALSVRTPGVSAPLSSTVERACARLRQLEDDVAETRRVMESEALRLHRACAAMQAVYAEMEEERRRQGHWLTPLVLRVGEAAPVARDESEASRRRDLDVRMATAEIDDVVGLDRAPSRFTLPPGVTGGARAKLRRTESTMAAFAHRKKELESEVARVQRLVDSAPVPDPRDREELARLRTELAEMGDAPRRLPRSPEAQHRAESKAAAKVARDGPFRVLRLPRLAPALFCKDDVGPSAANRAASLARIRVQVRLLINGHPVATTDPHPLGPDFSVDIRDRLRLVVHRWPEDARAQVLLRGRVVGEARIYIPGAGATPPADPYPVPYRFSGRRPFRVRWAPALPQASERDADRLLSDAALGAPSPDARTGHPSPTTAAPELVHSGAVYVRCAWAPLGDAGAGDAHRPSQAQGSEADLSLVQAHAMRDHPHASALMPPAPPPAVGESRTAYFALLRVMRWLASSGLDPNDPRNADLLELKKYRELEVQRGGGDGVDAALPDAGSLRLQPAREAAVGRGGVFAARRAKMLRLRWEGETRSSKSMGFCMPISDGQVQDLDIHRLLKRSGIPERDLRQRVAEELDLAAQERLVRRAMDAPSLTALQDRSRAIAEFAYDIRQAAVAGRASEGAPSLRATDDVVRQPRVDLLRLDVGGVVRDALRPRAKLRPARQRAVVASTVPRDLALVVVVQSAEHLPMRAEAAEAVRDAGGYLGPSADEQALLACFAEVLFGDYAVRTQTQIGTSASFNEVLTLPVEAPDGQELTPRFLWLYDEPIVINFFDEVAVQTGGGLRPREGADLSKYKPAIGQGQTVVTLERRFLGSLRVPFSSVFKAGSLQGSMRIDVPAASLGYTHNPAGSPSATVFITMSPQVPHPDPVIDEQRAGESPELQARVAEWQQDVFRRTRGRNRASLVAVDKAGTAVLMLRYVAPIPSPPSLAVRPESGAAAPRRLAWFVSHVPFVEDDNLEADREDIWMTAADFVRLGAGDQEEHACLLAGYFLNMGQEAFVVSGTSTASSSDYFVLTTGRAHDEGRWALQPGQKTTPTDIAGSGITVASLTLWNATKGTSVPATDPQNELRAVSVVFNGANAWANVQPSAHPWEIDWDLDNPRLWMPLFSPAFPPRSLASVQGEVSYEEHRHEFFEDLARKLAEEVREVIRDARLDLLSTTAHFDATLDTKLKRLLRDAHADMERGFASLPASDPPPGVGTLGSSTVGRYPRAAVEKIQGDHRAVLLREFPSYDVQGVLLHMPFGDIEDKLAEVILNTDLHMALGEGVKFGVDVHCQPMGCRFAFPVYIYLVHLRRKPAHLPRERGPALPQPQPQPQLR